jgi:uncharacterized Zn-finger protein
MEANRDTQPAPQAAIDLIHKQPVRFLKERVAVCDGGGGPLGHPRIYINLDKAQIVPCEYCGLPFVSHAIVQLRMHFNWRSQRETGILTST